MVWVGKDGEVHIEALGKDRSPVALQERRPEMKFRLEAFRQGGGYVGKTAARDEEHVQDLFDDLVKHWADGRTGPIDDEM